VSKRLDFEDIEGKTIAKVFETNEADILIVFADGDYCCMYAYGDYDGDVYIENCELAFSDWEKHLDELLALGVLTQERYGRHKSVKQSQEEVQKNMRRAEYERLKAEFESE
jgi:hypothetical protein